MQTAMIPFHQEWFNISTQYHIRLLNLGIGFTNWESKAPHSGKKQGLWIAPENMMVHPLSNKNTT